MLLLVVVLGQAVFKVGDEFFPLSWVTIGLGTAFFIVFDLTLTLCISLYIVKLRKKLKIGRGG